MCGAGREYEIVRLTRVTVGYLADGQQGTTGARADAPSMVELAGLELDLEDLAALWSTGERGAGAQGAGLTA